MRSIIAFTIGIMLNLLTGCSAMQDLEVSTRVHTGYNNLGYYDYNFNPYYYNQLYYNNYRPYRFNTPTIIIKRKPRVRPPQVRTPRVRQQRPIRTVRPVVRPTRNSTTRHVVRRNVGRRNN